MEKLNSHMFFFNLIRVQLLTVFVALKLSGHIDWSWWWVTLPLWIGDVIVVLRVLIKITQTVYDAIVFRWRWKTLKK